MPEKRTEDRAKVHREYVRQMFRTSVPTENEIAEVTAEDKKRTIHEYGYDLWADDFRRFLKEYAADNRQKRARAGAEGLKQKRQNNG